MNECCIDPILDFKESTESIFEHLASVCQGVELARQRGSFGFVLSLVDKSFITQTFEVMVDIAQIFLFRICTELLLKRFPDLISRR